MNKKTKYNRGFSSFSVMVVFAALILIGFSVLPLLDVKLEPSRVLPRITVNYSWPNASSRVVEEQVTSPLEGMFSTISGIRKITSESKKEKGSITIEFKKQVNLDAVRFEVATMIRRVYPELPDQVSYPYISLNTGGRYVRPILTYNLNAAASPYYIQKYAGDHILPKLSKIKGLNDVNVYGATPFEWELRFDVEQIYSLEITANDIADAINSYFRRNIIGMGAFQIPGSDRIKTIRIILQNDIPPELSWDRIPIKKSSGRIIYLEDVVKVKYREQPPSSYFRINGMNTINMVFYPEEGANNIKVAKMVKDQIEQLKKTLPAGYSILLSYDQTKFVSAEIHKVIMRTIFSMIILLIFVLLISRQFRYLVLILVSLTANLVIAAIFYYLLKIEIHLYSLAGITVSFGIIIDNSIVMIDHLRHQGNKKVFLAILAATLTTVGALSILFFLSDAQKINLIDFAEVIIVNLFVSLLIALFFIPALIDKLPLVSRKNKRYFRGKRRVAAFTRHYSRFILSLYRIRWAFILLLILGFGLPVYMLPEKIGKEEPFGREQKVEKEETTWVRLYNKTIGSSFYQQTLRPVTDKVLGGALRLFTENVFESSFYSSPQRTILYVTGGMPEGSTVRQLNEAVQKMENFINKYDEVQMYETSINNYRSGRITIYFKPEVENESFPYFLKGALISKANNVGGLDWSIYGIGRGFSNALYSGYKNSQIILEGYNYDQLYSYANQLKKDLLKLNRVQEVDIIGGTNFYSSKILHEYFLDFNREQFGMNEVSLFQFYNYLLDRVYKRNLNRVYNHGEAQPVVLLSDRSEEFNVWDLKNEPVFIKDKMFKLGMLASVEKKKTGNEIFKENQQYQLSVAYDFIGPGTFAQRVQKKKIEEMNAVLPLGYKARSHSWWGWRRDDKSQYYLIFLVIVIIYFICSILLESLVQPLAIISMIPLAYIGVFLTFYLFDFNFDQGGFASFILLAGIVVNSGLYIINDYNNFCRERNVKKSMRLYLKAFNHKIIPVYLTILSTILGLFPFIWGGQKEVFWFAFAVGAMGGLIFSLLAVLVYLPLFMGLRNA